MASLFSSQSGQRDHLGEYDTVHDGRLFRGEGGGLLSDTVCTRTWERARQAALTPAEAASRWPNAPTTCGMPAYPPGSTPASHPPR